MNQTHRKNRNRNHTPANTQRTDATEAALSLILPPAAFKVFQCFLGVTRLQHNNPAMTMREAFTHLEYAHGCDALESAASALAEAFRAGRTIG